MPDDKRSSKEPKKKKNKSVKQKRITLKELHSQFGFDADEHAEQFNTSATKEIIFDILKGDSKLYTMT